MRFSNKINTALLVLGMGIGSYGLHGVDSYWDSIESIRQETSELSIIDELREQREILLERIEISERQNFV